EHKAQVWDKVLEEIEELKEAENQNDPKAIFEEFGDVLFAMVNYARYLNVDPESALEAINQKFIRRFSYIEQKAGDQLENMSLDAMDQLWNEAKSQGL
nr:MazG nucleotide pyrophosphohydrolase domain-containing protein [Saprospiraceae bacterium]